MPVIWEARMDVCRRCQQVFWCHRPSAGWVVFLAQSSVCRTVGPVCCCDFTWISGANCLIIGADVVAAKARKWRLELEVQLKPGQNPDGILFLLQCQKHLKKQLCSRLCCRLVFHMYNVQHVRRLLITDWMVWLSS